LGLFLARFLRKKLLTSHKNYAILFENFDTNLENNPTAGIGTVFSGISFEPGGKTKTKLALPARKTTHTKKRKTAIDPKKRWRVGFRYLARRRRADKKSIKATRTSGAVHVWRSFWYRLTCRVRQFNRWQLVSIATLVLLFSGAIFYYYINWVNATSEQLVISSQADWEAGEYQPGTLDTTTTAGSLTTKSGGVGTWDVSTPHFPEDTRGRFDLNQEPADVGADLVSDGSYLYMIIGGHQPEFFRYNPDVGTWKQLADAPTEFYHGAALTYRNGTIYAINGSDGTLTTDATAHFFAYDIAGDTWSQLEDAPAPWLYNADLVAA
jgi:hypothetical protein